MVSPTTGGRLFRAQPLPTRAHPGPRLRVSAAASWAEVRGFVALLRFQEHAARAADAARLVATVTEHQPRVMTGAGAAVLYGDMILTLRPLHYVAAVGYNRADAAFSAAAVGLVQWLLATQGGEALAQAIDRVRRAEFAAPPTREVRVWSDPFCLAARSVLTQAPLRDYEAAMTAFTAIAAEEGWRAAALFAVVLADDRPEPHALQPVPVLRAAVDSGAVVRTEPDLAAVIADAPPGAVAEWRNHRRGDFTFRCALVGSDRLAATLAAVAQRNGEPALPSLSWLLHHAADADRTSIAKALLATRQNAALDPLLPYLHRSWARAALARAEACDPAWTMRCYLVAVTSGRGGPTLRARCRTGIAKHGAETVRAWVQDLGPSALSCLDELIQADRVALAPRETWPDAFRDPPWRDPARRAFTGTVLHIEPLSTPLTFDGEVAGDSRWPTYRERRALVLPSMASLAGLIALVETGIAPDHPWALPDALKPLPSAAASEGAVLSWLEARLAQIDVTPAISYENPYEGLYDGLERQPAALALRLWRRGGPFLAVNNWRPGPAGPMLRRFGQAVVPEFVALVAANPAIGFDQFAAVGAGELAPVAAHAAMQVRPARARALAWLRRHRSLALMHLVPRAVGPSGPEREEAGVEIRRLRADPGGVEAVAEVVERYAAVHPQVRDAVDEVLAFDEILLAPERIRPLPSWFSPSMLSRPELRSGGALGDDAVVAVGEVLSFSMPDNVHAGLERIRQACTTDSLGRFASDVLAAWFAAGTPGQHFWALRAVGWLGDDASIPPLMSVFRRFIEARVLPQAAMTIEALAGIGSDAAIAQLGRIGEGSGFKSMRGKARRHLEALAQARGLTREELDDRTAPDLGLDARGGLDLDFGPRRFRVALDANLRPVVHDAGGRPLTELPKPRRSDDAELAAAARERWRVQKRGLRAAAGPAKRRLETMLVTGRRVTPEVFQASFAHHAFVQNLSGRLLWGVFDDPAPDASPRAIFRPGGNAAFVGVHDEPVAFASDGTGTIGLVHPLQLASPVLDAWRTAFARHAIAQPFPQLERATYRLSSAERGNPILYRFQGLVVEAGWLRGMGTRGWPFDRPVEDALMWAVERDVVLRDGRHAIASLAFAPGIQVGMPAPGEGTRVLDVLRLLVPGGASDRSLVPFDELDPVTASEIIREIDTLAHHGCHPAYEEAAGALGRVTACNRDPTALVVVRAQLSRFV